MCGAARELAVALATKGFTDWSCPPEAKQRTFLPPVDDGLDEMIGKLVMRQDRQQDGEAEASQGVVDRVRLRDAPEAEPRSQMRLGLGLSVLRAVRHCP